MAFVVRTDFLVLDFENYSTQSQKDALEFYADTLKEQQEKPKKPRKKRNKKYGKTLTFTIKYDKLYKLCFQIGGIA